MITGKECQEFLTERVEQDRAREMGKRRGRETAATAHTSLFLVLEMGKGAPHEAAYRQAVQEGFDGALGIGETKPCADCAQPIKYQKYNRAGQEVCHSCYQWAVEQTGMPAPR